MKKANGILGMIKRNIKFKNKTVIVKLYKSLVRPLVWNIVFKHGVHILKRYRNDLESSEEGNKINRGP